MNGASLCCKAGASGSADDEQANAEQDKHAAHDGADRGLRRPVGRLNRAKREDQREAAV